MGQRSGFTSLDLKKLDTLYECGKTETVNKPVTTTTTTTVSNCNDAYSNGLCYTWLVQRAILIILDTLWSILDPLNPLCDLRSFNIGSN